MNLAPILLVADDCSPFENQEGYGDAIQYFISKKDTLSIFKFKNKGCDDGDDEIAFFNYRDAKWYAGRFIGEATFEFNNLIYKITINPRFGKPQLFRMLEEVYNIRLPHSKSTFEKQNDYQYLIKKLIAFLWLNLLSKANKHGIPKQNTLVYQKSSTIRGKIDIRKTVLPLYTEKKLVSKFYEKSPDKTITNILMTAQSILKSEYNLTNDMVSISSKNAIEQLFTFKNSVNFITKSDYKKIQYKSIYMSFKPIVDLSWDIIKKDNFGNDNNKNNDGLSFFIDVAEIWEMYLRSILKKHFAKEGWSLRNDKITTYRSKDFQRTLIPDIILEKVNDIMIWDAKYKRMEYNYFDFDRADFFQIHTYLSYFNQSKNVVIGGLLYPLSKEFNLNKQERNKANSLFSEGKSKTKFAVDGIDYSNLSNESINLEEANFLNRISSFTKESTHEHYAPPFPKPIY
jgi:5-methylcytosine-specific restriction enzyme subunit McrC